MKTIQQVAETVYRRHMAEVRVYTQTCTSVVGIRRANEELIKMDQAVSRDNDLPFTVKRNLRKEIYIERRRLPDLELPGARKNTFVLKEQQLFRKIKEVSVVANINQPCVTRMVNDCIVDGVPNVQRLEKLQRIAVYNRSNDVRMEKLTRLYLADMIPTRTFFEIKNTFTQ